MGTPEAVIMDKPLPVHAEGQGFEKLDMA